MGLSTQDLYEVASKAAKKAGAKLCVRHYLSSRKLLLVFFSLLFLSLVIHLFSFFSIIFTSIFFGGVGVACC